MFEGDQTAGRAVNKQRPRQFDQRHKLQSLRTKTRSRRSSLLSLQRSRMATTTSTQITTPKHPKPDSDSDSDTLQEAKKRRGHKGNNGGKGKPSNNKGKKRETKVPRASKIDMALRGKEDNGSDLEEDLPSIPLSIHMYRSAFIAAWCSRLITYTVEEDPRLHEILGHGPTETPCIYVRGEQPSAATAEHRRKRVLVRGSSYELPSVGREGDRHVRPYHFWMYNSGQFTRAELGTMTREGEDAIGASHVCGGSCLNHLRPEANTINQGRKPHHAALTEALEGQDIERYKAIRSSCNHNPKCFVNPGARNLATALLPKLGL